MTEERPQQVSLRTAYRDVRVTAPWPQRRSPSGRAAAFARSLQRRYQSRLAALPFLGLFFRQPAAGNVVNPVTYRFQFQVAPRLSLALGTSPGLTALRSERMLETLVIQRAGIRFIHERRQVETLVERLAIRQVRVDSVMADRFAPNPVRAAILVEPTATRQAAIPPTFPTARPASRVVRRSPTGPVASPQPLPPTSQALDHPESQPRLAWRAAGEPPSAPAAVDVNRLADHVIQVIDRRISAHRERLGRG